MPYAASSIVSSRGFFRARLYRVAIIGLVLIYAVAFHASVPLICDQFSAQAAYRICVPPDYWRMSVYTALAVLPALFLPASPKVSSVMIFLVYMMHVFSFVAVYPYIVINDDIGGALPVVASLTFCLLCMSFRARDVVLPRVKLSKQHLIVASLAAYAFSLLTILLSFDITFQFVSIFDVYDVRSEFKNQLLDNANPVAAYMVTISAYAVAPGMVIISKYLWGQRWLAIAYVALGFILAFAVYSLAAYKSGIFIMIFTVLTCYGGVAFDRKFLAYFLGAFAAFAALIFLASFFYSDNPAFSHWYRRAFVVPGINVNVFYNYIGNSMFSGAEDMPLLVSRLYYGTQGSANSGVYGDGLAKAGYLGVFLNVVLLGLILKAMDATTRNLSPSTSAAFFLPVAYALANSATTTVILTYGGAVALGLAYLLNEHVRRKREGMLDGGRA